METWTLEPRRLMQVSDRPTTARRSAFVPLCAVRRWLLAVAVLCVGCLNPMPDDFPQDHEGAGTGSDNGGIDEGPATGSAGASGLNGQDPNDDDSPVQSPPAAGGLEGDPDAGVPVGDAGAATRAADAGAPDAGAAGSGDAP